MDAVGRLAGGVAHEANNQMSVVLSASAFILQHEGLPEAVQKDVEAIAHEVLANPVIEEYRYSLED